VLLEVRHLTKRFGGLTAVSDMSFALDEGDIVGIFGPNGSGKTTLLETMLGRRAHNGGGGKVRLGHGVEVAYFSQQEVELDERGSVLDCAQGATGLRRPDAQNLLGRFLFSGWEEQQKAVTVLSGGERRRLALALVVASGANFLVLDEPTNHLDLESREALEAALEAFPGTILLVSHDRALLDAVAERTLAIEDGRLGSYDGGWADYVRRRAELDAPPDPVEAKPAKAKAKPAPKPKPPQPSELERIEADIEKRERAVAELEQKLADDWTDVETLAAHRRAREELQSLISRWEEVFERR
jgi:ATP-binding cassette subfamily F protein 3